jgi:hypothetical protein
VRDDRRGQAVSEREGETAARAGAGAGAGAGAERVACWAALLGQRERGRARGRMGRSVGRTGGREENRPGSVLFVFLFQINE